MLERIRIVLVNTSHPGNIGAAARAMKTMGLATLYLVSPSQFPHFKAEEMASGAGDILKQARVVESLDQAIADCTWVVGTSARMRTVPWPLLSPRSLAEKIHQEPENSCIAIIFGREQTGLTNEELKRCHAHVHIPSNPLYSSLNIASAVQLIAYELRLAAALEDESKAAQQSLATSDEMERFFQHLQQVLTEIDFLKVKAPRKLMMRLRRLFYKARLDNVEINILRGILTAVQEVKNKESQP